MKQFNLEEYLRNPNRKIVTRNRDRVRILATDCAGPQPVAAIYTRSEDNRKFLETYSKEGYLVSPDCTSKHDLFFADTKKEGYQNLYRYEEDVESGKIYKTKKEALDAIANIRDYIDTIRIEWEE